MPVNLGLRFICACRADSQVTAWINCGLKMNLFLSLNQDGVLRMWFPLEVSVRVRCPPVHRRRVRVASGTCTFRHSPFIGSATLM